MLKNEKKVPIKNYIYLSLIILATLSLSFYLYLWYLTYQESKLNNEIMNRYLEVINYNELSDYITENKDAYVYVSVLENQNIRDFEKKFKTVIMKNYLKKEILYLDLTEEYNNKKEIKNIENKYKLNNKSITNLPCILVFRNGNLTEIYDIKENNYSIDNIKLFLQEEGLEIDD